MPTLELTETTLIETPATSWERWENKAWANQERARVEAIPIDTEPYYNHINSSGYTLRVFIAVVGEVVRNPEGFFWRKVICKPVGYNNCPQLSLDYAQLTKVV